MTYKTDDCHVKNNSQETPNCGISWLLFTFYFSLLNLQFLVQALLLFMSLLHPEMSLSIHAQQ